MDDETLTKLIELLYRSMSMLTKGLKKILEERQSLK